MHIIREVPETERSRAGLEDLILVRAQARIKDLIVELQARHIDVVVVVSAHLRGEHVPNEH